jgi:hypothetical protein
MLTAEILRWRAIGTETTRQMLEVQVKLKELDLRRVYTRYLYRDTFNSKNNGWIWSRSEIEADTKERCHLSAGEKECMVPVLDRLVLAHPELRQIAKLFGYAPEETLKDSLDKVLESSAS